MAEKTIRSEIKEIIDYLAQQLEQNGVSVDKIVLFGSQLKGNLHIDSDIDIIVVSKSFRDKDIIERAKMISRAHIDTFEKYPEAMDIIMETPEEYNPDFGMIVYAA